MPNRKSAQFVKTESAWLDCLDLLKKESRLAIDLEANSMYAYRERICLVQISTASHDFIIDPLEVSLEGLGEILISPDVEKVFHAVQYDAILFKSMRGWTLNNTFDTMWSARMLGYERIGLGNLLERHFGVVVDKKYQKTDWCKRPLTPDQLHYAQNDTHYLLELRDILHGELAALDLLEEAQDTFAQFYNVDLPDRTFHKDSFWKVNGVQKLPKNALAVFRELYIYREKQAKRKDRPPFKIMGNKTLMALAERKPSSKNQLHAVTGMSPKIVQRYGNDVLRIIADTKNHPIPQRPPRPPRPSHAYATRYDKVRKWRQKQADKRSVESDVIISKDAIREIATKNPTTLGDIDNIEALSPYRRKKYAKSILHALHGKS